MAKPCFSMTPEQFEQLVAEEFESAIPEPFRDKIKNVAFLTADEPTAEVRQKERLGPGQTLLGYYQGIPYPSRGSWYGMGATLPDTITLFRLPIEEEAHRVMHRSGTSPEEAIRQVVRDTIWHEVAHHFGMNEKEVRQRESERRKKS